MKIRLGTIYNDLGMEASRPDYKTFDVVKVESGKYIYNVRLKDPDPMIGDWNVYAAVDCCDDEGYPL